MIELKGNDDGVYIEQVSSFKYLSVMFNNSLKWSDLVESIV